MFAHNKKLIKFVYDEVKKFEGEPQENPWRCLFFEFIYPNSAGQSPFDMVIDKMDMNSI